MTEVRIIVELPDRRIDIQCAPEMEFSLDVPEQVAVQLLREAVADVRAALNREARG